MHQLIMSPPHGDVAPKPRGGGHPPALDEDARQRLRQIVQKQPDATWAELRQQLGLSCSLMAVWRTLRELKITRKKKSLRHEEQDRPDVQEKRQAFQEEVAELDPECLIFVDETGANTAMTRTYGRAPTGERVSDRSRQNRENEIAPQRSPEYGGEHSPMEGNNEGVSCASR